ncbi:D-alanyl-D-alanine carboxypeptidase family protein [Populibacterium corticicola]|uniref:D-alanyl-D-alanine carboxypeptidase family protein n=1 Tax=Populibacterium corticicola TaxID=1812826 RepID=A0ABW5XDE4_9MICO
MSILNGRLIQSLLSKTSNGHTLRKAARNSYERLNAAFTREFGYELRLTQGYRTYAQQESIFLARYDFTPRSGNTYANGGIKTWNGKTWHKKLGVAVAAQPGYSNHGLGLAIDVNTTIGFGSFTSAQYTWLAQHGPAYGWTNTEGRSVNEPWHWVYNSSADRMKTSKLKVNGTLDKPTCTQWQIQLGVLDPDGDFAAKSCTRLQYRLNGKNGKGGFKLKRPLDLTARLDKRTVMALQKLLNVWHARTSGAAAKFVLKDGPLKVDGVLGPRTIKALQKSLNLNLWK